VGQRGKKREKGEKKGECVGRFLVSHQKVSLVFFPFPPHPLLAENRGGEERRGGREGSGVFLNIHERSA